MSGSKHVDEPMSNTELRLTLADISNEIAETKGISMETHAQAVKTNGRVTDLEKEQIRNEATTATVGILTTICTWLQRGAWTALGMFTLLTLWAGWVTKDILDRQKEPPQITAIEIKQAIQEGIVDTVNAK